MFDSFCKVKKSSKAELMTLLHKEIGFKYLFNDNYTTQYNETNNNNLEFKLKWNGQINSLITIYYDLMHAKLENTDSLLECNNNDIKKLLNLFFVDKYGKAIKTSTIDTCLKEYRPEKRANGKKRIQIHNLI